MDCDASPLDMVLLLLTIYKQVANLVYIENYPIDLVTIKNIRDDMQAGELLIKIWNKI